jgi:hypothetical protein
MSKLIEEDIAGGCTKVSEVVPKGIQPPEKTIYTYTTLSPWTRRR